MEAIVGFSLKALALYLELGLGWAIWLHVWGLRRTDPGVEGAGFFFRLLITPGLIALWPLVAARSLAKTGGTQVLGGSQSPVSSRGLRTLHFRLIQILAPCLPLFVGLALSLRPAPAPSQVESPPGTPARLPESAATALRFTPAVPLAASISWSGAGAPQLRLQPLPGFEPDDWLLYWTRAAAEPQPGFSPDEPVVPTRAPADPALVGSVLLGSLPRGGEAYYTLPAEGGHSQGQLRLYALRLGRVMASAPVPAPVPMFLSDARSFSLTPPGPVHLGTFRNAFMGDLASAGAPHGTSHQPVRSVPEGE